MYRRREDRLLQTIDAWWARTDRVMALVGWGAVIAAPLWIIIKAL